MKLSPQQTKIYQHMREQSAARPYREMAKELAINPRSYRTQLSTLRDMGLIKATDPDGRDWVYIDPNAVKEPVKDVKEPVKEPVKDVKEPVKDSGEAVKEPVKDSGEAVKEPVNEPVNETKPSREDVGMTERQIFEQKAKAIGNMPPEKLTVIADLVWEGDPHNLDEVWAALNQTNLPIDVTRMLFASWRSFLRVKGMPEEISEAVKAVAEKPLSAGAKDKGLKGGENLNYFIQDGEIVKAPEGYGDFTLADAKEILVVQALKYRFTNPGVSSEQARANVKTDSVADLILALTPLLDKGTDQNMLKELLEARSDKMLLEFQASIPQPQPAKVERSFLDQFKDLKEIIGLMGLGQQGQPAAQAPAPANIQLQNPDGSPMVMDIGSFLTIKKFEIEEKKEAAAEKRREKNSDALSGFMGKIADAAGRVASGGK